ncbi:MAG: acetylxylan esterase [Planctomycetes bacterium]|nr:acetylxylan esterase [Planctomycetota bacterium]
MRWTVACLLFASCASAQSNDVRCEHLVDTNTRFELTSPRTRAAWEERRAWLLDQVRIAAGLVPEPERTPLHAEVFDPITGDGYVIEKVCFESRPGLLVTGNLYRPHPPREGVQPGILCPHGHWGHGRLNHEERGSIPARCITLARAGATVFAYDMVGYQDSGKQFQHRDPALLDDANLPWGIGPLAVQTWNSVRALDFLLACDGVDPERIGVTGASGGGTQTFLLTALDERVRVAAPVNMVSHTMQGGCVCENAPGLRIDANNVEIAALAAPRPLLLISASGDWTKETPQVEFPFVRAVYGLYGAASLVENVHRDAPHNYDRGSRDAMYAFFSKWLFGGVPIEEQGFTWPPERSPNVFAERPPRKSMLSPATLVASMKEAIATKAQEIEGGDGVAFRVLCRRVLMHAVRSDVPSTEAIASRTQESGVVTLTREGRSVAVRAFEPLAASTQVLTLVFSAGGIEPTGAAATLVESLRARGHHVWAPEPFGVGRNVCSAEARRDGTYFTTFHRTDHAETIFDMLTVVGQACSMPGVQRVELVAFGDLAARALAARVIVPDEVAGQVGLRLVLMAPELALLRAGRDEAYDCRQLFVPNVLRVGGVMGLVDAVCTHESSGHRAPSLFVLGADLAALRERLGRQVGGCVLRDGDVDGRELLAPWN